MPQRELCAYLQDVLDAVRDIQSFTAGLSFDAFSQNNLVRAGVERKFEIIGEALNQANQHYSEHVGLLINNKGAIGQRNVIAHGYFVVDPARLWFSMEKDIPNLATEVETLKSKICADRHI